MTDNEERRTRFKDRRYPSMAELTAIVVLVVQLGALIWGAATLNASVNNLTKLGAAMQSDVRQVQNDVSDLKVDVGILKARGVK